MSSDPFSGWSGMNSDARFTTPEACQRHATSFEKLIRRRNFIEYAAGVLVFGIFGLGSASALVAGEWGFAISMIAVIIGTGFLLWKLHRDGSNLDRRPEITCRDHLRDQLKRQRDLLRGVPRWYLAPLVPGILGVYLTTAYGVARAHGWEVALGGIWQPLGLTIAFFCLVAWLNLRAARQLDRKLASLEAIG
ncbi:MAG: hypothetical protein R3E14_14360 [Erythrobacter sp.]